LNRRRADGDVQVGSAVAVVFVLAVAAGCAAPASRTPSPPAAPATVLGFPDARSILLGPGGDAESSVEASADGQTILVCSHGGFTQPSPLWVSTDAGASFKRVEPQPNQPFDGDCDVAIAPDGTWAIVYDTAASATVAVSTDQGASWSLNPVSGIPLGGVDRPWLLALGHTLYLDYKSVGNGAAGTHILAVSADGGLTWVPHAYMPPHYPDRMEGTSGHPFLLSDDGRGIGIAVATANSGGTAVYLDLAMSRDGGATWTSSQAVGPIPAVGGIPGGTRAGDGTLYLTYTTPDRDFHGNVYAVVSTDDGATWSAPQPVAGNQTFAGLVATAWADGRPDGGADVAWMSVVGNTTDGKETWQMAQARLSMQGGFHVAAFGHVGETGTPPPASLYEFSEVDHDAAGRTYVADPLFQGPQCKQTPAFPSQVGSQSIPRNTLCGHVVVEP
jgi:hypothetical protein